MKIPEDNLACAAGDLPDDMAEIDEFVELRYFELEKGVEIISWGLAPNPDGYCWEYQGDEDEGRMSDEELEHLDLLCDIAPRGYL